MLILYLLSFSCRRMVLVQERGGRGEEEERKKKSGAKMRDEGEKRQKQ